MEDFIVQKTIFHKYNYEPGGLGNYNIYSALQWNNHFLRKKKKKKKNTLELFI